MKRYSHFLLLLLSCLIFSCSSTKKSIHQFSRALQDTGLISQDTARKSKADANVKSNASTETVQSGDSSYERTTEETVIDWIVADPPDSTGPTGKWNKVKETRRKIMEKGVTKKDQRKREQASSHAAISTQDSSGSTSQIASQHTEQIIDKTADKKKNRVFPGWIWIVIAGLILGGTGYATRDFWALRLFGWKPKNKNHDT